MTIACIACARTSAGMSCEPRIVGGVSMCRPFSAYAAAVGGGGGTKLAGGRRLDGGGRADIDPDGRCIVRSSSSGGRRIVRSSLSTDAGIGFGRIVLRGADELAGGNEDPRLLGITLVSSSSFRTCSKTRGRSLGGRGYGEATRIESGRTLDATRTTSISPESMTSDSSNRIGRLVKGSTSGILREGDGQPQGRLDAGDEPARRFDTRRNSSCKGF
jgi:hypothetical protein